MKGTAIAWLVLFSSVAYAEAAEVEDPPSGPELELSTSQTIEATTGNPANPNEDSAREPDERPLYVPPRRGAPATRVGGGTRSGESSMPKISPLSPIHTGLTIQSAPKLYWWLSEDHDGVFEFVVTELDAVTPVVQFRTESRHAAGIHSLDLAAHDIELKPGHVYQWSVAIVRDDERRSHDIVGIATIERIESDESLTIGPAALAAAGLWYDAIQVLSETSDAANGDEYLAFRADLLEQVGLAGVAAGAGTVAAAN